MTDHTEQSAPQGGFRPWMFVPAIAAFLMGVLFFQQLFREDAESLPSTFIGKPAPEFALPPLNGEAGFSTADLMGPGAKLVNVWASWCGPCRAEHPILMALAAEGVPIFGINQKDAPQNARAFLAELGDPYQLIGTDRDGRGSIEWGVYGVPETFVINGAGEVIYKHIGPISP
ncbi:MAG: DsbE family thiol:disulfide interchange protein, partial [Pseudomonadota bacterium]